MMRITHRLILSLLVGTGLIFLVFSFFQTRQLEERLNEDQALRAELLAGSIRAAIDAFIQDTPSPTRIEAYLDQLTDHPRLLGTLVRLREGALIALPPSLFGDPVFHSLSQIPIENQHSVTSILNWNGQSVHYYAIPLLHDGKMQGSLSLILDRSAIIKRIQETWVYYGIIFSILAVVLSVISLIIVRWTILSPLHRISEWTKRIGAGKARPHAELLKDRGEMGQLLYEVANMATSLQARQAAIESRSGETFSGDGVWTRDRLKEYLTAQLGEHNLYVVANREPYQHIRTDEGVVCRVPPSGMVTALDPVLQSTGGVWVAHGSGNADRETADDRGRVQVPPENPSYTLKRVWLSEKEEKGFYSGFSNEGIWPLCHIAHTRPIFRARDWEMYQKVNRKFANALVEELSEKNPYILVQDYHFALLPKYIKEKNPRARVALFWHIPWPNPEVFGICPWKEEILEGMLGADLVSFHTQFHCNNFLETVNRVLESRIDWTAFGVTKAGKTTLVRPFPISIDPFVSETKKEGREGRVAALKKEYGLEGKKIGLGVDRIDYIKGLVERFIAIERLFEKYPKYLGNVVFVELGAPSRDVLAGYMNHMKAVERKVEKINQRFGSGNYKPILFLKDHHAPDKIRDFYSMADFCVVNSLHDGMNLVAKEYVAGKDDLNGALVLSRFTGASLELKTALFVNPYNIEETAEAMHQALSMGPEEKRWRMQKMRDTVVENNIYRWAAEMVSTLIKSF